MASTTGAPQQKYEAAAAPDLVDGAYATHTHTITPTYQDLPDLENIAGPFADASNILCGAADHKISGTRSALQLWNFMKAKGDTVYAQKSEIVKYHENLGNIIPTSANIGQPRVDIVTHDLHVLVDRYPPMASDSSEQEVSIARIVGTIEISNLQNVGGDSEEQILTIDFEPFNAGTTYNGASCLTTFGGTTGNIGSSMLTCSPSTGSITSAYVPVAAEWLTGTDTATFVFV